jgi:hypothetical protein
MFWRLLLQARPGVQVRHEQTRHSLAVVFSALSAPGSDSHREAHEAILVL